MLAIDTDVLSIHHIFTRDERYKNNEKFMDKAVDIGCTTTIFNLLELCGIIATAGSPRQAELLYNGYFSSDEIELLMPTIDITSSGQSWERISKEIFQTETRNFLATNFANGHEFFCLI